MQYVLDMGLWSLRIGTFDFIILNEMTHEVPDMAAFFRKLKVLLKDNAPIVVLARPKNPPLPVPECCLMLWRKLAPTREEVLAAVKAYSMHGCDTFRQWLFKERGWGKSVEHF
ncbi:hypothetical protein ANCDUO_07153 [Ancylostoma duodenale]|uniref:Uncharacterized protein n=1 Tax=Ancylostoma duodenale TaxID=51022 RepID=A0A0C2GMQ2_9BILA|nr:hypothetical protein ANCDUO_07153 [Ancylostoma duodenale]